MAVRSTTNLKADFISCITIDIEGPPAPDNTALARIQFTVQGSGKSLRLDDVILAVAGCANNINSQSQM